MTAPSEISRRITGTFIEDQSSSVGVLKWIEESLRDGQLRVYVESWLCENRRSHLQGYLVLEAVEKHHVICRIPAMIRDHESAHPFQSDIILSIEPLNGRITELHELPQLDSRLSTK